jgi:hypothetical protein
MKLLNQYFSYSIAQRQYQNRKLDPHRATDTLFSADATQHMLKYSTLFKRQQAPLRRLKK